MQTAKSNAHPTNLVVFESTIDADHLLRLPAELPAGLQVRVTIEPIRQKRGEPDTTNSEIVRLLHTARQAYIDNGGRLMDQDEILAHIGHFPGKS